MRMLEFALQPDLPFLVYCDDDADVHVGDDDADNNDDNGGRSLNRLVDREIVYNIYDHSIDRLID